MYNYENSCSKSIVKYGSELYFADKINKESIYLTS